MEVSIGLIAGQKVGKNRDGWLDTRLLQVIITDPRDGQTVELAEQHGSESNPPDGCAAVLVAAGEAMKLAVAVVDGIPRVMARGGKRVYSTDEKGERVTAELRLNPDGSLSVGNAAGVATLSPSGEWRFTGAKVVFDCPIEAPQVYAGEKRVELSAHAHGQTQPGKGQTGEPV